MRPSNKNDVSSPPFEKYRDQQHTCRARSMAPTAQSSCARRPSGAHAAATAPRHTRAWCLSSAECRPAHGQAAGRVRKPPAADQPSCTIYWSRRHPISLGTNVAVNERGPPLVARCRHRPLLALCPRAPAWPMRHGIELGHHVGAFRGRAAIPRARPPSPPTAVRMYRARVGRAQLQGT